MDNFSNYIVYVDESGDHGLSSIDPDYPVFILAFCIFHKKNYMTEISPRIHQLKFQHFGHDMIVLHEENIRKATKDFKFLTDATRRESFLSDLDGLVDASEFILIAIAIKKDQLKKQNSVESNPYHIALCFGLERIYSFLKEKNEDTKKLHIIFECRGKKEDVELELEFRRICDGQNFRKEKFPYTLIFADKKVNSCGLQLADLVARPIGRNILKPEQPNRAYETLKKKFYRKNGRINGYGLKCFP